jgi:DNA gyrase subunit B
VLNTESASLAKVLENKELSDLVTALGCGLGKNFDLARLRYGRIIILADADSDGHHIATLLLTFIYRHMPALITSGHVFLAQPPLYRIDIGKERSGRSTTRTGPDPEAARQRPRQPGDHPLQGPRRDDAQGAVGDDDEPAHAPTAAVEISDQIVTDRIINELMGKDPSARFRFIMDRAEEAVELDV